MNMNSHGITVMIAAIAMSSMAISSIFAATASASVEGREHAQQPGKGVCNADDKIHHNAPSQADEGFHGGVEKNFGGPTEGFVGPNTPCRNVLP
jgi:hypothetical protein